MANSLKNFLGFVLIVAATIFLLHSVAAKLESQTQIAAVYNGVALTSIPYCSETKAVSVTANIATIIPPIGGKKIVICHLAVNGTSTITGTFHLYEGNADCSAVLNSNFLANTMYMVGGLGTSTPAGFLTMGGGLSPVFTHKSVNSPFCMNNINAGGGSTFSVTATYGLIN